MFSGNFALYENDVALSGIGRLSLAGLQRELRENVPAKLLNASATSYQISNVRYKAGEKLVIGLVSSRGGNPVGLRIVPQAKLGNRLAKARQEHPEHTFVLHRADAVAWVFPAERKLKLAAVADREVLREILLFERGFILKDIELVHFVPEHSYTARLCGEDLAGNLIEDYLKIYYDDHGARTYALINELAVQLDGTRIALPSEVTYLPKYRMLLQRSLQRDTSTSLQLHDAARALAQFHSLPQSSAPQIIDSSEGDIIATSSLVYAVFPSAADRVAGIGSSIVEQLHNSSASTPCLIHGDAHLGNFFPLIDGRIGIIDLDTTVVGPAEWDLASFFGFKIWIAMRERCDVELVLSTFPSFVGAYNESTVNPVSLSRACIVLAQKMLTERISRGICRGKITGLHELNTFLDVAERCLVMAGAHDA